MKKLYVGNLPFQATEEDISTWFGQAGVTPANVTLVRDRFSGQPRGFGFVEVNNDEDAGRAIEALNGHDFMGRNVVVNEARPPREGGGRRRWWRWTWRWRWWRAVAAAVVVAVRRRRVVVVAAAVVAVAEAAAVVAADAAAAVAVVTSCR